MESRETDGEMEECRRRGINGELNRWRKQRKKKKKSEKVGELQRDEQKDQECKKK